MAVELVEGAGVRPATFEYYEVQRNGWTGSKKKVGPLTGERWVTSWTSERRSGWGPSGGETYYDVPGTWFTRSVYVSGDGRALTNVPATDVEIVLEQGLEVADPTRRWKQLAPPLNSILAMAADYAGL